MEIELFPFSFREFLKASGFSVGPGTTKWECLSRKGLSEFIETGGGPEVVAGGESPKAYLRQLYNDIVEKDIIFRHNISYRSTFREIAATVVSNYGRYVTSNSMRRHFNLGSDHTARNYPSYLEEAYILQYVTKRSPAREMPGRMQGGYAA